MNIIEIFKDAFAHKGTESKVQRPKQEELSGHIYKYVVVSDTHQLEKELDDLLTMYPDYDGYFHIGDSELSSDKLSKWKAIKGNHDTNDLPEELIVDIGKQKALLVHSHRQYSFYTKENLVALAKSYNVQYVFYGHNHVFDDKIVDGVRLMNPGSLRHSRDNATHSYALFEIDEENHVRFTRQYMSDVEDNYTYEF